MSVLLGTGLSLLGQMIHAVRKGAAGFIASHVTNKLINEDIDTIMHFAAEAHVDNSFDSFTSSLDYPPMSALLGAGLRLFGRARPSSAEGCGGFIVSHVTNRLIKYHLNYKIIELEELDYCLSLKNLNPARLSANFKFVKGELASSNMVRKGAAGFIASHVTNRLIKYHLNYKIIELDELNYCLSLKNLNPARLSERLQNYASEEHSHYTAEERVLLLLMLQTVIKYHLNYKIIELDELDYCLSLKNLNPPGYPRGSEHGLGRNPGLEGYVRKGAAGFIASHVTNRLINIQKLKLKLSDLAIVTQERRAHFYSISYHSKQFLLDQLSATS
ncbi:hypothetical protein Syun_019802 [Stephania yunnanensis]|uniref:Uncharacterized protein n=1 Tax=Stephania yunnanensis TaxID=152371 RepID=A0AAP0NYA8_9MAGN